MPTKTQRRGTVVAAMVAMLRLVLLGTLGTDIVKESEVLVSLALRLTSVVVEVERCTRIKELAVVEGRRAATKEKLASIGVVASFRDCS